jgi:tripartite-type tricarboxylate transporter receptor subunit TctC
MPALQRITPLLLAAALAAPLFGLAAATSPAAADDYPSRPVKLIVPFGAGGPTDIYTRAVAEELQKALKQPFVMENRPGAGTTIGTEFVAKSPPDGYTLLMISGTQTVNETLFARKNYKLMTDLVPVAPLINTDLVLVVHPSVPAKNIDELLALAKAKPGTINYGSSGLGSNYHMAGELLKNLANVDIVHVPYKGSTGARNDILGGQIPMLFDSVPSMAPIIKSGMVRALATTGKTRSLILPDVPTLDESGVKGFQATLWVGVMAPAGTPKEIVDKLNSEISRIVSSPAIKKAWDEQGANPITMTQPQFKAFMDDEVAKWAKIIKANNIQPIN